MSIENYKFETNNNEDIIYKDPLVEKLIKDFDILCSWQEKYSYLIECGKRLQPMDLQHKNDRNKVHGCSSQVWMFGSVDINQKLFFEADSDSHIVKGLIAILFRIYSGKTKYEISSINITNIFIRLGLHKHLTPSRSNGFFFYCE